jgi:hypothetical protein
MLNKKLLSAALLASAGAFGASLSTYTRAVITPASSVTITNADHGMGSTSFGVGVWDDSDLRVSELTYSISKNGSTYAVTITFDPGYWPDGFSGTIKLKGNAGFDTSGDNDWKLVLLNSGASLGICSGCTNDYWVRRTVDGLSYVGATTFSVDGLANSNACQNTVVYLYLYNRRLYASNSYSAACLQNPSSLLTTQGSGYPTGSVPIGTAFQYYSGSFYVLTDDRPWAP